MQEGIKLAFKPSEVAILLGISKSLVYRLIHTGVLPHIRLGERRIAVPAFALEGMLKNGILK